MPLPASGGRQQSVVSLACVYIPPVSAFFVCVCLYFPIFQKIIYLLGFPGGSDGKESAFNAGDLGSIPGVGRSPGRGHGNPLQYSLFGWPGPELRHEGSLIFLWQVGCLGAGWRESSSLTRDQTQALCIGCSESQPLDHQRSLSASLISL